MPTYEYQCGACGHRFEKFQSITAEPIKLCPQCNKKKVKRLIGTGAGLIFKGSGFYITDYRSDSYKSAAKSESGASSSSGSSSTASPSGSSGSAGASKTSGASSAASSSSGSSGSSSTAAAPAKSK